jgi:hypothetical protein
VVVEQVCHSAGQITADDIRGLLEEPVDEARQEAEELSAAA